MRADRARSGRARLGGQAVLGAVRTVTAAVGAVVRRGDAMVAAEGLGELGGLAVADAVRDLAHGQAAAASSSAARSMRTRVRCSRNVVSPISA